MVQIGLIIIFTGCVLDTFGPDNLATWNVNLNFPILKTTYAYLVKK